MWFHEIPLTRHIGITRCTCVRIDDSKPWHVLTRLGFLPVHHHLVEVPAAKAHAILQAVLWKDLAYSQEVMPIARASQLATAFIHAHSHPEAHFFSNADWTTYHDTSRGGAFGFNSLTDATFDGGIVAVCGGLASCAWVEDED
jgi:hypothetical protein